MSLIQIDYRKTKSQYNLFLNKLKKLEEERKEFNKKFIINAIEDIFDENEIGLVKYIDRIDMNWFLGREYKFIVCLYSNKFIESKGKDKITDDRINTFKDLLHKELILSYEAFDLKVYVDVDLEDYVGKIGDEYFEFCMKCTNLLNENE